MIDLEVQTAQRVELTPEALAKILRRDPDVILARGPVVWAPSRRGRHRVHAWHPNVLLGRYYDGDGDYIDMGGLPLCERTKPLYRADIHSLMWWFNRPLPLHWSKCKKCERLVQETEPARCVRLDLMRVIAREDNIPWVS